MGRFFAPVIFTLVMNPSPHPPGNLHGARNTRGVGSAAHPGAHDGLLQLIQRLVLLPHRRPLQLHQPRVVQLRRARGLPRLCTPRCAPQQSLPAFSLSRAWQVVDRVTRTVWHECTQDNLGNQLRQCRGSEAEEQSESSQAESFWVPSGAARQGAACMRLAHLCWLL